MMKCDHLLQNIPCQFYVMTMSEWCHTMSFRYGWKLTYFDLLHNKFRIKNLDKVRHPLPSLLGFLLSKRSFYCLPFKYLGIIQRFKFLLDPCFTHLLAELPCFEFLQMSFNLTLVGDFRSFFKLIPEHLFWCSLTTLYTYLQLIHHVLIFLRFHLIWPLFLSCNYLVS